MGAIRTGSNVNVVRYNVIMGAWGMGWAPGGAMGGIDWQHNYGANASPFGPGHQYLQGEWNYTRQKVRWDTPELFFYDIAAADPGDCTLNVVLEDMTLISQATVDIEATLAKTLGNVTLDADASVDITATLGKTLAAVTLVGAASVSITATLARTLGNATLSAAVQVDITAVLNQTLEPVAINADAENDAGAGPANDYSRIWWEYFWRP